MKKIYDVHNFDYSLLNKEKLAKRPRGNPRGRKQCHYKNVICAFDIETTNIPEIEQSVMYIWQFQYGLDYTIIGRTWDEFLYMLEKFKEQLSGDSWMVIFVHNLSFEWQFLSGIYDFLPEEVFATESRKILKCEMYNCFEFRCSYLHSNMSLKEYTTKMGVKDVKLSGEDFDYSKQRFSWTPLTEEELHYCINDVKGLVEAITIEMEHDGDTLHTFPLTSTGYVRRDVKRSMYGFNSMQLKEMLPDENVYGILREAFRGGNCHANRYFAGDIIENVRSYDRSSSYPDVMCNCKFPMTKFQKVTNCSGDYLIRLIKVKKRAVIFRARFYDLALKNKYTGIPYLSTDKCRYIKEGKFDNGRILSAEYLETSLTDIDFKIILSMYKFSDCQPYDIYYARYDYLPKMVTDVVKEYYKRKTELKGNADEGIYYMKAKNKLNSCYGMCVQDVAKRSILYKNGEFVLDDKSIKELIAKNNRKAFLSYRWGVYVRRWARYRLQEGIDLCGDNIVYVDTDSCKYVGDVDWSKYNEERKADSLRSGAYAYDSEGKIHYMGVYEPEDTCQKFKTLGAKKYVGEIDGKLKITIAGVGKYKGAKELEKYGGITAFKEGFTFVDAGGTESKYNDLKEPIKYKVDGHEILITSNIYISDSTYTLGITAEYDWLLTHSYDLKYSQYKI
jgi:hypothetical protein